MLKAAGCGAIAAVALAWLGAPASAQTGSKAAAKPYAAPRTADGAPDLQGVYNVATITPLERPAELKGRLVLTDQEAAALEEYERQRNAKSLEPSAADRQAPPVGGERSTPKTFLEILERLGGGPVGGYNNFWLASGTQVITVDGQKRSSIVVDPPDGRVPPMTAAAQKRNNEYLARAVSPDAAEGAQSGPAGAFDGPEVRPLAERCILGFGSTSGPPTLPNYFYNNLKQIVQTKDTVMILNEMVHDARIIRIGGRHAPPTMRKWLGDSIGRWEGDTLVVETTNFTGKTQFRGSGEKLKVTERFRRVDPKTILYQFTVEDPDTWPRPWSGEYPWVATDEPIYEYACHEGNYSLEGILKGARLAEQQAAKK
jgi:hypothetical protein